MLILRQDISRLTIQRMVLYHSVLKLMQEEGITICISKELGRRTGISPHLIRKDLAYFGEFGTKGVGYATGYLYRRIEEILGYDTSWNTVLVGLEMPTVVPIMCYPRLWPEAVKIVAVIDLGKQNQGVAVHNLGLTIESIDNIKDIICSRKITIGILAVPPSHAQNTADQLIQAGIKGIVNFSSFPIIAPEDIAITQVNMTSLFSQLTFDLKHVAMKDSCS
ncbi:Redox-sensing transcriptional repressor Rex 1 [Sporomusa silvacetica DSM 10669]|uniref:Redox-sensing transcriptional repressor Rex n=1 Tax=Sporomusa silvacetica DSM 10669 TaxID=1123289 RepID=A0ABZ3IS98_9FIRM|nr:redox-sensing transcriptional repressor Rex [Sporomusa silvacetica]OZC14583.1 redox-sensing transcriptional repressor Rex [Sporomusa silvacetica DSM 10669]